MLSLQGALVQSLVGELRSHMPCSQKIKIKKRKERDIIFLAFQFRAPREGKPPTLYSLRNLLLTSMGNKQGSQDHTWGISLWDFVWPWSLVLAVG